MTNQIASDYVALLLIFKETLFKFKNIKFLFVFTRSKLTIETLEQGVKYVQS